MRAAWWWIDRWRTSSAYMALSLAEQGAYRNLLDELWLRDGLLPGNERFLAMASGAGAEWDSVKTGVMAQFYEAPGGWRNKTHDEVMEESKRRSQKQARYRERYRQRDQNVPPSPSLSPDLSLTPDQDQSHKETKPCPQERTAARKKLDLPPFALLWNEKVAGSPLKTIRVWTAKRDRVVKARLAEEGDLGLWGLAMEHLAASPHHRGENDRGWVADVDFLLQAEQYAKWLDLAHGGPPVKADPEVTPQLRRLMGGV